MRHMGFALLVLLSACIIQKSDGESCSSDNQCSSDECLGGICTGSSCSSDGDCGSNFECVHHDGDPIFDIGAGYSCRMLCDAGACPEQWSCDTKYCDYVGPSVGAAVSNDRPTEHEVVTFSAAPHPDESGITYTWDFYMLGKKTGKTVEMTFETAGTFDWQLVATYPHTGNLYQDGNITVCAGAGDACDPYYNACCSALTCNPSTLVCE